MGENNLIFQGENVNFWHHGTIIPGRSLETVTNALNVSSPKKTLQKQRCASLRPARGTWPGVEGTPPTIQLPRPGSQFAQIPLGSTWLQSFLPFEAFAVHLPTLVLRPAWLHVEAVDPFPSPARSHTEC